MSRVSEVRRVCHSPALGYSLFLKLLQQNGLAFLLIPNVA